MSIQVAPFPAPRPDAPACAAALDARGCLLRSATLEDLSFMRHLYGLLRAEEVGLMPWPDSARQAFLDNQFQLQHHHFITHYALSDFLVIEHEGTKIGRFYLLREPRHFLIVDIALLPAWRGQGLGSALLEATKNLAIESDAEGVDLHVDERNIAARQLYLRQGFRETKQEGPYIGMRWMRQPLAQLNIA